MKIYQYTELELQAFANQAKDELLDVLETEGLLKESAEKIASTYVITLGVKGLFGRFFDKVRGLKDDKQQFMLITKTIGAYKDGQ